MPNLVNSQSCHYKTAVVIKHRQKQYLKTMQHKMLQNWFSAIQYLIADIWLRSKVHMTSHQKEPFLLKIERLSCFNSNWRQKCPSTLIVEIKTSVVLALQGNHNPRLVPLLILSALLLSLLGRTRFRGRCWAAILLSRRPETSDRAVCGEVDRLDNWRTTTWSTVCSSAPHSQAAEEVIPHLYNQ